MKEIRKKALFNVGDDGCKLHWQNNGDFLCVKVDRQVKNKQTLTNFELFVMRKKDIPVEVLEHKDAIIAFAWEPFGKRFGVIHGEAPRPSVSFYSLEDTKVVLIKTLEKKAANHIFWSPRGAFCVLAGIRNMNGALEFWNIEKMELMGYGEHLMATNVEWDPTGRFVATYVSHWVHQIETGYIIWTFQGKQVHKLPKDRFFQLLWRPRPPSLLSVDKKEEVKKNLLKYSKRYEIEDAQIEKAAEDARVAKRKQQMEEFQQWNNEWRELYEREKSLRKKLRNGVDSDDENDYYAEEEWVEELVEPPIEEVID